MIFYADLENDGKAERFLYGNDGAEGHAPCVIITIKSNTSGNSILNIQRIKPELF